MDESVDAPAYIVVGIPTDRIGPNLAAIVAVLEPLVDRVEVVDYRQHPEPGHSQRREQLAAWALDRDAGVSWLPHAWLSDVWNLLAARTETMAEGRAWTLVLWRHDARPDADVLEQLVEAVTEDYDVAFGPGSLAVGFPPGARATLCTEDHDSEADCILDLLDRIPVERRAAVVDDSTAG